MLVHPLPIWQAFPGLPVDLKRHGPGRGVVLGVLLIICGGCELSFIQTVIVPSGPLLWDRGFSVESKEEVLPFQFATKYVACINLPTSQPALSFSLSFTPLWFPPSPPIFPVVYLVILNECVKWTVLSPQKFIVLKYCLLICSLW